MKANDFIKEIDAVDQDAIDALKKQMDPADDDEAGMDKGFKKEPMITQLGKVLDSRGNPNPIKKVVSDISPVLNTSLFSSINVSYIIW